MVFRQDALQIMQESFVRPTNSEANFHGGRILIARHERPPASEEVNNHECLERARCAASEGGVKPRQLDPSYYNITCGTWLTIALEIKFSTEQPRCHECEVNDWTCTYDQGRRDRLKEPLEQRQLLVDVLKDIRHDASLRSRTKIETTLEALDEEFPDLPLSAVQEEHGQQSETSHSIDGASQKLPHFATSEVDFDFGPMGYAWGQNATVGTEDATPLSSLHHELGVQSDIGYNESYPPQLTENFMANGSASDGSSYIGTKDVEVDTRVNAHALPPFEIASRLFHHYSKTVHDWFPLLPFAFEAQVRLYYTRPYQVPDHWLATLNLVFAIGTQYCYLVNETEKIQEGLDAGRESEQYLSRALQLLQVKGDALLITNPEVPLVQCLGMLSFYYLAAGHVDRAWITVGIAFRMGISLDLHIRTPESTAWPSRANTLARNWWALRTLECLLGSITGRPSAIPLQDCNVPLPSTLFDGQEGRRLAMPLQLYFKISITSQWTLSSLYSVRAATLPWKSIEDRVLRLISELEQLLPEISHRNRLMLHFSWLDSMILVTRPCLCPRMRNDKSDEPTPTTQEVGRQCIRAAQAMTRLLTDQPDERIFRNGPWWCLCHYNYESNDYLAMSDRIPISVSAGSEIMLSIKKLVRWLRWMRQKSSVAEKSLGVVLNTLRRSHDHTKFADIFEQEVVDAYGGLLLVPERWGVDATEPHSQFLPELSEWDDVVDSAGVLSNMARQSSTDTPILLMPPVYGTPFVLAENTWHW